MQIIQVREGRRTTGKPVTSYIYAHSAEEVMDKIPHARRKSRVERIRYLVPFPMSAAVRRLRVLPALGWVFFLSGRTRTSGSSATLDRLRV